MEQELRGNDYCTLKAEGWRFQESKLCAETLRQPEYTHTAASCAEDSLAAELLGRHRDKVISIIS